MFTGIIEEVGTVLSITKNSISIQAKTVLDGTKLGDSISVNGVCLTVTKLSDDKFEADISPETIKVTALQKLSSGKQVNLERAMPADGRFGGHIVSGHVDGIATVKTFKRNGSFYDLGLELQSHNAKYVVKKGSIAINGVSLTVAEVSNDFVNIAIIPHTLENTSLKNIKLGDIVNIETDILAKYVEKFLSTSDNKSGLSMDFLVENGF